MTAIHPRGLHHMPLRHAGPAAHAITAIALVLMLTGGGESGFGADAAAAKATAPAERTSGVASGEMGSIVFRRWTDTAQTQGAIFTIAPDGTGERRLTRPTGSRSDDYPDFAADGSLIAFQRCDESQRSCRILTARPDGTDMRRVGDCRRGSGRRCPSASYPAISANDRIAFVRGSGRFDEDGYARRGIFTMGMHGAALRRVTLPRAGTARDDEPQWSPDGRRIVFVRDNLAAKPANGKAIFIVNADGSRLRRLTPWKLRAGDGPNWSPDGKRILFRSNESEYFTNSNLFTVGVDGTGLEQVTRVEPTTQLYSSGFSPDGRSITFGMQGTEGRADVFTMRLDGTGLTQVTRTPLGDSAPDWGAAAR